MSTPATSQATALKREFKAKVFSQENRAKKEESLRKILAHTQMELADTEVHQHCTRILMASFLTLMPSNDDVLQYESYRLIEMFELALHAIEQGHGNAKTLCTMFFSLLHTHCKMYDPVYPAKPADGSDKDIPIIMKALGYVPIFDSSLCFTNVAERYRQSEDPATCEKNLARLAQIWQCSPDEPHIEAKRRCLVVAFGETEFSDEHHPLKKLAQDLLDAFETASAALDTEAPPPDTQSKCNAYIDAYYTYKYYKAGSEIPSTELIERLFPRKYFPGGLLLPLLIPHKTKTELLRHKMGQFHSELPETLDAFTTDAGLHIRRSPEHDKEMIAFVTRGDEGVIVGGRIAFSNFVRADVEISPGVITHCGEQIFKLFCASVHADDKNFEQVSQAILFASTPVAAKSATAGIANFCHDMWDSVSMRAMYQTAAIRCQNQSAFAMFKRMAHIIRDMGAKRFIVMEANNDNRWGIGMYTQPFLAQLDKVPPSPSLIADAQSVSSGENRLGQVLTDFMLTTDTLTFEQYSKCLRGTKFVFQVAPHDANADAAESDDFMIRTTSDIMARTASDTSEPVAQA